MAGSRSSSSSRTSERAPDLEILGDQVTLHPSGYIEPERDVQRHGQERDMERNLVEHMARFRTSPLEFLREVSLHVSGTGWRAYDHFIGQPIFYPGFSENMIASVMSTPILQRRITELAEKRIAVEEKEGLLNKDDPSYAVKRTNRKAAIEYSLQELSEKMTSDMICKMESRPFIRGAYYLCTQLLTRAYHQGIHVSSEEVLRLRAVAEKAAEKKQSIIFLPCHRSHIDYVSLQLICYRLGLALPTVVAGDNLNFPVVGNFLQHAGAMWIRRSFGDDVLYTTLVQSYIDTLLQGGFNFECFIEGGRSRTGKLLPPKFGILSFILDSILSGRVEDAIICPVSTQYDKVIETEGYVTELLGVPKKKENLADFLSASSLLSLKLGRVDVRFHEPWSLKEFVQEQQTRMTSMPQGIQGMNNAVTKEKLLRTMGYKVLSDINAVSVVMPTALIGTVLLTLRGRGVGKAELIRRVEWLSDRVRNKGGRVAHFGNAPTSVVIERGLEVLGKDLVGTVQGLPEPTYYAVDRFQLSFYRNMTIHLFIAEALVCASMYTRVKRGGGRENQRISYTELRDQVLFLSQLFRGEFIYPTEGLAVNLDNTLRGFEADKIVDLVRDEEGNIVAVDLSDHERAAGRENFDFYCFLIWPFIEAFWLGAVAMMGFTKPIGYKGDGWLDVKKCQESAQLLGKTLYHQGDLSYFEAVNKETLKNAWTRFEEEGIIQVVKSRNTKIQPRAQLALDWAPQRDPKTKQISPEGRLWDFTEKIAHSRREGKNRRDGATVSTRVLRLTDTLGLMLYQHTSKDEEMSEEDRVLLKKKQKRRLALQARAHL
ncbi:acyltransferase [Halenospora varia]|nr:acyltransferase [Halenospora varia]